MGKRGCNNTANQNQFKAYTGFSKEMYIFISPLWGQRPLRRYWLYGRIAHPPVQPIRGYPHSGASIAGPATPRFGGTCY